MRLLLGLFAAVALHAQVNVFLFSGGVETPANGALDFGRVGQGDLRDLRIRLRGTSVSSTLITQFSFTGAEFSVSDRPSLPITVNAAQPIDVSIRFTAPAPASYTGILRISSTGVVNTNTVVTTLSLTGISVPAPTFNVVSGCVLNAGSLDFGRANLGEPRVCALTLRNPTAQPMSISTLGITGIGFELNGARAPVTIGAGSTLEFSVRHAATAAGIFSGTLTIDTRTYALAIFVVQPALPAPAFVFDRSTFESGQQVRLSLKLGAPAAATASGLVTITFKPDVAGVTQDTSIVFVATGSRSANFAFRAGETDATFGGLPFATFQTGTTAGTLTFTISGVVQGLAGEGVATRTILPAPIHLEPGRTGSGPETIGITLSGFDNTYSIGPIVFTFYDRSGNELIAPMRTDFTAQFRQYYAQAPAGSSFEARFLFAARGDVQRIGSVEVELINSTGKATMQRLPFP